MKALADRILRPAARLCHETLGLSPNAISLISFVICVGAAALIAGGETGWGMAAMAVAQIVDGLDGAVARMYGLQSKQGARLDTVLDRASEALIFFALVVTGQASVKIALLAVVAILLVTAVESSSRFDPGFKRFILYCGWIAQVTAGIRGMEIALHVIFLANLAVAAVGMIIAEYRHQEQVDQEAIGERMKLMALGLPPPPPGPPSFLSRLASWL